MGAEPVPQYPISTHFNPLWSSQYCVPAALILRKPCNKFLGHVCKESDLTPMIASHADGNGQVDFLSRSKSVGCGTRRTSTCRRDQRKTGRRRRGFALSVPPRTRGCRASLAIQPLRHVVQSRRTARILVPDGRLGFFGRASNDRLTTTRFRPISMGRISRSHGGGRR
jgi:hypothetical protein